MRVSIELVDTQNGAILLGERFDGEVHDAFELQDIIAQRVIGSIAPRLEQADIDRARRKGPSDIEAYDLFLQSLPHYHSLTPDGLRICLGLLRRAITLDPKFAITKAFASMCIQQRDSQGTTSQESSELEEGISFAREALIAGHDDPRVLMLAGQALAYLARDWDTSVAALDRALQINSFSSQTWKASGWVRLFAGDPHTAIDHLRKSISLSPRDPGVTFVLLGLGVGHMMLKRYEVSLQFGQQAMWESPKNTGTYRVIAASLALLGRTDDARRAISDLMATAPESSMELVKRRIPYRDDEFVKRYHDALRMAGMPENSA